jgi:prepilin-type N-terminal cleavage/methylation domain-containing protein
VTRPTASNLRPARGSRERGFSLLELLVALGIFTIVLGAIYSMLHVATSDVFTARQATEMLDTARIGLNAMSRDATNCGADYPNAGATLPAGRLAALLGTGATSAFDSVTPVVPGFEIPYTGATPGTNDTLMMIYRDNSFNNGNVLRVNTVSVAGDVLLNTASGDNTVCAVGELYCVQGPTTAALGWLTAADSSSGTNNRLRFENADPLNINQPGVAGTVSMLPTSSAMPNTHDQYVVYRVTWVLYYVEPTTTANPARTLMRRVFGAPQAGTGAGTVTSTGWLDTPICANVQRMRFNYILRDATVTTNPTLVSGADQRQLIRQAQVYLTVESPEVDPESGLRQSTQLVNVFALRNLAVTVKRPT